MHLEAVSTVDFLTRCESRPLRLNVRWVFLHSARRYYIQITDSTALFRVSL